MAEPAVTTPEEKPKGAWERIVELGVAALPPIASAIGIVTFVALIGGAIQWVRFWAAGLPADQAVRAMPKAELVVIGAVSLIGALLAGVFIVLVVFLVERQAMHKRKVTMWVLLVLTTLELMAALVFVDQEWWVIALLAAWFVVLGLVTARTLRGLPSILSRIASRRRLWAIRDRFERAIDDYTDAEAQVRLLPPNGGVPPETVEARNAALRATTIERDAAKRERTERSTTGGSPRPRRSPHSIAPLRPGRTSSSMHSKSSPSASESSPPGSPSAVAGARSCCSRSPRGWCRWPCGATRAGSSPS